MRFLLKHDACRSIAKNLTKMGTKTRKSTKGPVMVTKGSCITEKDIVSTEDKLTKSWGQQCSPSCGCVLRFETITDERQMIVDCRYVAKSVVTKIDKENGGRLTPVYSTRKNKPMLQECKCRSLHALANHVTSYLPSNRWNHVQDMNNFTSNRSSIAFRHAVLSEHGLPRTDTHCFDIVEEAFTGLFNGRIPSKRRINEPFGEILAAEYLQRQPLFPHDRSKRNYEDTPPHDQRLGTIDGAKQQGIGANSNRMFMSTPQTISELGMFDIDTENLLDESQCDRGAATADSESNEFDWVSYVDEQYLVSDLA